MLKAAHTLAPSALALSQTEADRLLAPLANFDHLALAVSGGPDSVALMHLAASWRKRLDRSPKISVLTVDHGLRPGSAREAESVCNWASALGLACAVLKWDARRKRGNLQQEARTARYQLMAQECHAQDIDALVTAHHLDDQAETFLLRLARGSGVDGLGAMSATAQIFAIKVLRPLLDVPRERLAATLAAAGQDFIRDPSNDDVRFARVRLRALAETLALEGLTPERLAATARRMRRARAALDAATDALAARIAQFDMLGFCTIGPGLGEASEEIALRLLARVVMAVSGSALPPDEAALERMHAIALGAGPAGMTLAGCRLSRSGDKLVFAREEGRKGLPELILQPGVKGMWDGRFCAISAPGAKGPLVLRALGAQGVAAIRHAGHELRLGGRLAKTCPSLWRGQDLVYAPAILRGYGDFGEVGLARIYPVFGEAVDEGGGL